MLHEVVGCSFANEGFAAARRAIEQEAFGSRVLELLKQFGMQSRQFNGVPYCLNGLLLAADPGPGHCGDFFEKVLLAVPGLETFEGHFERGIDADLVADLQLGFFEFGGAFQNQILNAVFAADAQTPLVQQIGDFGHRTGGAVAQIADHCVGLVDQHPGAHLELGCIDAGIDVGIVFRTTDKNGGKSLLGRAQINANAIGWSSYFFQRRLELDQGPTRLLKSNFLLHELAAQPIEQGTRRISVRRLDQQLVHQLQSLALVVGRGSILIVFVVFPIPLGISLSTHM